MESPTITILAAGEFPRQASVLRLLDESDMVVCCDSAAEALVASGREPDLIVGDMDSLPAHIRDKYKGRLRVVPDQETNDLTKAFHVTLEYCPAAIHILGATGLREDHTLANISLLADYQEEAPLCRIDMVSDQGRFVAASGQRTFASLPGQGISIFAFDASLHMTAAGLQYPLDGVVFDTLWKASLNVATGTSFTLTPNGDSFYLVYLAGR